MLAACHCEQPANVFTAPLLSGDAGVEQTVNLARALVDQALKDPYINRVAVDMVRSAPHYDDLSEVRAIYDAVHGPIRYVKDAVGKEVLRPAHVILELGAGDCDDINAVLLPALLGSIGYPTRIVTIAASPGDPEQFSHVYCEVLVQGQWVPLDAARPGAVFGEAPPHFFRKRVWSITDDEFTDVSGLSSRGLNGLAAFDWAGLIQTGGQAAANIIRSASGQPQPSLYYTSPGLVPAQRMTRDASPGMDNSTLIWIGLGLLALWAVNR